MTHDTERQVASPGTSPLSVFLGLARAIGQTHTVEDIYATALDALHLGIGVSRSAILLFDADGVMRFKASRGLSDAYLVAVEGHSPWPRGTREAEPIVVPDVTRDAGLAPFLAAIRAEGIAALAFVPLMTQQGVIGKFMLYFAEPIQLSDEQLQLASAVAAQVAFAVDRTRAEAMVRRSEERLRFALDAAAMGTWDWDLTTNEVVWSDNLERIHGLPSGSFDGSFASYEREIHPDDRGRVFASIQRALAEGAPHEVEYRIVAPDGTVRWCEGKGRVEHDDRGKPVRMSGVCVIVTRRKEAELARLSAAEEASRLKDEFLATLSHELRTPLNAILGWTQMLQSGALGPERTAQAIEVISRNARLQARLIEDILDVSRIITGKLPIERRPVSLAQILDTVLTGIQPLADAGGLEVSRVVAPDLPIVEGDAKRLHQVLNNVLVNAVKFTPRGGTIRVSCVADHDRVRIEVADTGVGITAEFLPFVFDRFRQADSRATRRHGGLGLGLSIAQYIVDQHDGTISAASDGPGTGTTVAITLPVAAAGRTLDGETQGFPAAVRLDGATILVVDDQDDGREVVAAVLEAAGAEVIRCGSAHHALDAMTTAGADLLVADIAMPDTDGYALLRTMRARGNYMPAIAVTAFARPEDHARAMAAGFDEYSAKPVDRAALLMSVQRLIESRREGLTAHEARPAR